MWFIWEMRRRVKEKSIDTYIEIDERRKEWKKKNEYKKEKKKKEQGT